MSMVLRSGRIINPYFSRRYVASPRVVSAVARRAGRYARVIGTMNRAMMNPVVRTGFMRMRARLRRKVTARKKVGFPPNTKTARFARQIQTFDTVINDRTLFSIDVTDIPRGSALDERLRDVVEYRGLKICMRIRNTDSGGNLYFHWALISPKEAGTVSLTNFFRADNPNIQGRGMDFDTTLDAHQMHCSAINPDKFNIIRHRKYTLGTVTASSSIARNNDSWREINEYIPIKRQLRFDSDNSPECTTPMYLVYWGSKWNAPGAAAPSAVMNISYRMHAYYNNPKNA